MESGWGTKEHQACNRPEWHDNLEFLKIPWPRALGVVFFHADFWILPRELPVAYDSPWLFDGHQTAKQQPRLGLAAKAVATKRAAVVGGKTRWRRCSAKFMLVQGRDELPLCVDDEMAAERDWYSKGCWWWERVADAVAATQEYCGNATHLCPWVHAGGIRRCAGWADAFFLPSLAASDPSFGRALASFEKHNTWHETETPTLLALFAAAQHKPLLRPQCHGDCCRETPATVRAIQSYSCGHKMALSDPDTGAALWTKLGIPLMRGVFPIYNQSG